MSPDSVALLINPEPAGHIVYPYTDGEHIAKAVSLFAGSGLSKGEAVILVMARDHFASAVEANGQLLCCEAESLLSSFCLTELLTNSNSQRLSAN